MMPANYRANYIAVAQRSVETPIDFPLGRTAMRRWPYDPEMRTDETGVCIITEKPSTTIDFPMFSAKHSTGSKHVEAFTRLVFGAPKSSGRTGYHPSSKARVVFVVGNGLESGCRVARQYLNFRRRPVFVRYLLLYIIKPESTA